MTDRQIVESILTYCKGEYSSTLKSFTDDRYAIFNIQDQCIHLNLFNERLTFIPEEMLELKHLEFLNLSCNKLTFIPKELNYIKELYFFHNPILESKDKLEILFNKGILNDR